MRIEDIPHLVHLLKEMNRLDEQLSVIFRIRFESEAIKSFPDLLGHGPILTQARDSVISTLKARKMTAMIEMKRLGVVFEEEAS